jgi:dynein heavy chain
MTPRARWMACVIADVFSVSEGEATEALNRDNGPALLEAFFKGAGPAHIFVYYQTPYRIVEETGEIRETSSTKEFVITDGEKVKLKGKGLYFLRCNLDKPVNVNGTNDNEVLVGEVSEHSVTALNTTINQVFKPLVDNLAKPEWGVCEDEQKKEFTSVFDKFANELREALKSIQTNIQLEPYPDKYEDTVRGLLGGNAKVQNCAQMVEAFQAIFDKWSNLIQETLEGNDAERKESKDAGPKDELDYWKQRMRRLTGISEQLRSKNCRTVYDALTAYSNVSADQGGSGKPRDSIYLATSKWRGIMLRVTEALNEAKDNVKYLQTLEKFIEPLDNGTPETIKDILPALMNSIKMIHTIARYYNTNERMTGLFAKITTSMIRTCKLTILNFARARKGEAPKKGAPPQDDALWEHDAYPPDELIPVFQSCIDLNKAYQKQYDFTKERLMNMPKGKQFEFSPNQIFGRFDLFCRRIGKLIELFGTIQQFRTLGQHKLENIESRIESFNKHVKTFQRMNHRLLDYTQNKFDRDFVAFNVNVSIVESELQAYIHNQFERVMSIDESLKLLRKFKSILHRENLAGCLNAKTMLLFQNYGREIHKIERHYQEHKPLPPIPRNLPTVSGSIAWSRHLFNRISVPMEQFPQDLIKQAQSKKYVKQYNKIGYTLFSYEYLWR